MPHIVEFTDDEKKIHNIFLTANFLENLGVDGGKMGCVIYLLNRCRSVSDKVCEDLAFELLEEIDNEINDKTLVRFRFGLCGIGWGFEYLIRNRFLEVETDLCAPFEDRIWTAFQHESFGGTDLTNGIVGYMLYFLARIESSKVEIGSEIMHVNKHYIVDAVDRLEGLLTENIISDILTEKDNSVFGAQVPLILSRWEYPLVLWVLGRVFTHGLCRLKAERLLAELTGEMVVQKFFPKQTNNRELLVQVLQDISRLDFEDNTIHKNIDLKLLFLSDIRKPDVSCCL